MSIKVVPELASRVYYVGVEDWDRRIFDALIPLPLGTSYNSYLIVGKTKTALIDTVQRNFSDELLEKIQQIVDPAKIDFVVMNHAEPDHAGSIPQMLAAVPNAKLVVSKLGAEMANIFHGVPAERAYIVKEGDTLDLGGKTLRFFDAPWLHWPETMFTYLVEDKILFPCDFFGAHMAKSKLFDDEVSEVLLRDAKRYYAEIMMPFPVAIQRALDKVKTLDVNMIAPSHGPVYRNPRRILDAYEMWARGPLKPKVVLMYVTMWGSTEAMEKTIADAITAEGVEVVPYNLLVADISHVMMDLVDASAIVVGTPTVLNGPHPVALTATVIAEKLKPRTKLAAVFGSYGWGRGGVKTIADSLKAVGFEIVETLEVRGPPKKEDQEKAAALGKHVAQKVKETAKA
jgi:flavorubredoxin